MLHLRFKIVKRYIWILLICLVFISCFYFWLKDNRYKRVEDLILEDKLIEAKEYAIKAFDLDHSNCSSVIFSENFLPIQGGEVVAQTNFDQVVRLKKHSDLLETPTRFVSTLYHEFLHCNQNQFLYEYLINNNANLNELKLSYPKLSQLVLALESKNNTILTDARKFETLVTPLLSGLANYLRNYFEIDALVKTYNSTTVQLSDKDEQDLIKYLEISFKLEFDKRGGDHKKSKISVCKALENDLDRVILEYFINTCMQGVEILRKFHDT